MPANQVLIVHLAAWPKSRREKTACRRVDAPSNHKRGREDWTEIPPRTDPILLLHITSSHRNRNPSEPHPPSTESYLNGWMTVASYPINRLHGPDR